MKTSCLHYLPGFFLIAALLCAAPAPAATVNVCDEASLRAAVAAGGTTTFGCDGMITLASPIEVTNTVVLDATGRDVTFSGAGVSRVFLVQTNGSFTMVNLKVVNGQHSFEGAGILNLGNLTMRNCFLSNNVSLGFESGSSGGGAVANRGMLNVSDTTFAANVVFLEGGAIFNTGVLRVNRCAFIGNRANFGGGAISARASHLLQPSSITNSTFFQNAGRASDIYNAEVISTLGPGFINAVNCTFSTDSGSSIGTVCCATSRVWVANSILRWSTNQFIDGGNNLHQGNSDNLYLGPMANNGGPTPTRELLPDSPAIDQGNNALSPPMDQRGVVRPIRAQCDIGAVETSTSPSQGTLEFASPAFTVSEATTNALISIIRSGNSGGSAAVNFSVGAGSATPGQDFVATNGTVIFAPGQIQADLTVRVVNNSVPEANETVVVTLHSPTGNTTLGSQVSTILTVQDDDPTIPGTLQFQHAQYATAEGLGGVWITVNRIGGTNGVVSAQVTSGGGTASENLDYVATNFTLTLGDTETSRTFLVVVLNDPAEDGSETFNLALSNPGGGASLGNPSATTITITDRVHALSSCDEQSLRAAVNAGGKVQLACNGIITLTNPLIISNGVSIEANDHGVTLSGGGTVRHFIVAPGTTLALKNLILADGYAAGTNGNTGQPGGTGGGGAIYNNSGTILAQGCQFLRNRARGGNGGPAPNLSSFGAGAGGAGQGGVFYNAADGRISATNCTFVLNQSLGGDSGGFATDSTSGGEASGGVVHSTGGRIFLASCSLSSNKVASGRNNRLGGLDKTLGRGGAIYNDGSELVLSNVELAANSVNAGYLSASLGGAIHQESGVLRISNSYLHDNRAEGGSGAGIGSPFGFAGRSGSGGAVSVKSGVAEISGSTFSKNTAVGGKTASFAGTGPSRGGAIFNSGVLNLTNSTLIGNEAFAKDAPSPSYGGSSYGGGLCNQGGMVTLNHTTIVENSVQGHAVQLGGGVFSTNGVVDVSNSIIANSPSGSNCFGTIIDAGHNLSSDGSANFTAPGSLNNTDPVLGPLADYGGPTPTVALLNGSPAIDAASSGSCPPTDQRGVARPFGTACDIGAFESSPPYTILGRITGFTTPASGLNVSAGTSVATAQPGGDYALHGLVAGSHLVTPTSPEAVFVLSNRVVDVIRDTIGVDFHSYRSNALVIERIAAGVTRSVFAGEAGQTYWVELSTSLSSWVPHSTNVAHSSGLFEFNDTNAVASSPRMFRVIRP